MVAVVGQLVFSEPSAWPSLPSKIPDPYSGAWEVLAYGPGHCTYLPPSSLGPLILFIN